MLGRSPVYFVKFHAALRGKRKGLKDHELRWYDGWGRTQKQKETKTAKIVWNQVRADSIFMSFVCFR